MREIDPKVILTYLSDKCNKQELTLINEWMEEDDRNSQWLFDMKALWDMERFKDINDRNYLETQFRLMRSKMNGLPEKGRERSRRLVKVAVYVVAACLIGFIVGYGLLKPLSSSLPEYIVEKVSSSDSIRRIILPDHSVVWLNANSQIKYLPQLGKDERRVLLTGEAYFEVTPDKEKPFRVETSQFAVKVLGTAFNVSSYDEDFFSNVTLISGKVTVEDNRQKEAVTLSPGQKARYSKETKDWAVDYVDTDSETSWKNTYITFEHAEIKRIIEKLEYVYGERIILRPKSGAGFPKTYSGAVAREDSLENVLKNLQNVIPFHFEKNHEGFIISMKTE